MRAPFVVSAILLSAALHGADTPVFPFAENFAVPAELKARALALLPQLADQDPQIAQAAADNLKQMDLAVLPLLEKWLADAAFYEKLPEPAQARLRRAVAALEARNTDALLASGTPVKLDLKDVRPDDVLEALSRQTCNALPEALPFLAPPFRHDFQYSGNFWGAMRKLCEVFPVSPNRRLLKTVDVLGVVGQHAPAFARKITRAEDKWEKPDVAFYPRDVVFTQGLLCLRVARVSLDKDAAGEFIRVALEVRTEDRFAFDELDVRVAQVSFDNGVTAAPSPSGKSSENASLAGIAFVSIPMLEKMRGAKKIDLTGTVQFTAQEFPTFSFLLEHAPCKRTFSDGATLTVSLEGQEVGCKIQGHRLGKRDQRSTLECFDKDGNQLRNHDTSTSYGMDEHEEKKTYDAAPAKAVVHVPGALFKGEAPFSLNGIVLPLAEALPAEAPDAKQPADEF